MSTFVLYIVIPAADPPNYERYRDVNGARLSYARLADTRVNPLKLIRARQISHRSLFYCTYMCMRIAARICRARTRVRYDIVTFIGRTKADIGTVQ